MELGLTCGQREHLAHVFDGRGERGGAVAATRDVVRVQQAHLKGCRGGDKGM